MGRPTRPTNGPSPGCRAAQGLRWAVLGVLLLADCAVAQFHIPPYLQDPAETELTVIWFSPGPTPGSIICRQGKSGKIILQADSRPIRADALAYTDWESTTFFEGQAPPPPWQHDVRVRGLQAGTRYVYKVVQGQAEFSSSFGTVPEADRPVRFIAYADSETEPESTGKRARWADPANLQQGRYYLIDQTQGYAQNLAAMRSRAPDFIVIAGDLVQHGGEQRHWDEFWRHNTDADPELSLADSVPILPALGNHEYYAGHAIGQYDQPHSEAAVARYMTYFRMPDSGVPADHPRGRFYRVDYGPVTLVVLDVNNGRPQGSDADTNSTLVGQGEQGGGRAPDFQPGSYQYRWLEEQLKDAQRRSKFTFVALHQCPYGVGPHGKPAGPGTPGTDRLSGVPVRSLIPLLLRYGVDAVLAGHDEMYERSEVAGQEATPDGGVRPHTLHVYDVGIGGDGLRGPVGGVENPQQRFLAHTDAPEVWTDGRVTEGGKHYGHLEVEVAPARGGGWQAVLTPVYVLPSGEDLQGWERKVYDDVVILRWEGDSR